MLMQAKFPGWAKLCCRLAVLEQVSSHPCRHIYCTCIDRCRRQDCCSAALMSQGVQGLPYGMLSSKLPMWG